MAITSFEDYTKNFLQENKIDSSPVKTVAPELSIPSQPAKPFWERSGIVQDLLGSFYNLGKDLGQLDPYVQNIQKELKGRQMKAAEDLRNNNYVSQRQKEILANLADGNNPMYKLSAPRTDLEVTGDVLQSAAWFIPGGWFMKGGAGIAGGVAKTLGAKVLEGATVAGSTAAIATAGAKLSEGGTVEDAVKAGVLAAPFGIGLGVAIPVAGSVIGKAAKQVWGAFGKYAESHPDLFISSVGKRIENLGEYGKQFVQKLQQADTETLAKKGEMWSKLNTLVVEDSEKKASKIVSLVDIPKESQLKITAALDGYADKVALSKEESSIAKALRSHFDSIGAEGEGVKLFKQRKDYFPHSGLVEEDMTKSTAAWKDAVKYQTEVTKAFDSEKEFKKAFEDYLTYVDTGGKKGKAFIANFVRNGSTTTKLTPEEVVYLERNLNGELKSKIQKEVGTAIDWKKINQAKIEAQDFSSKFLQKKYPGKRFFEKAREMDHPFYDPNVVRATMDYSMKYAERYAQGITYGVENETIKKLRAQITDEVRRNIGRTAFEGKKNTIYQLIDTALGQTKQLSGAEKVSALIRTLSAPKLVFSQIINLGQSVANPALVADMPTVFKGILKAFTKEGIMNGMRSGSALESTIAEITNRTGDSNFASKLLKWTGFSATEKFNRIASANIGMLWVEKNFLKLMRGGLNPKYVSRLEELGIDVQRAMQAGHITEQEAFRAAKLFTDKTQFRARPIDLPLFAQSPMGKIFFQFKSFSYNQSKLVYNQTVKELISGNYGKGLRNLIILGTIFPMTGEVLSDIRSLASGTKKPTDALKRYIYDIGSAGGMGLAADLIESMYTGKLPSQILGPTLSSAADLSVMAADVARKAFKGKAKLTDAQIRLLLNQTGALRPLANYGFPSKTKDQENTLKTLFDLLND